MFDTTLLSRRVAGRPFQAVRVQPLLAPSAKVVEMTREHFAERVGTEARLDCPASRDWLARQEA